MPVADATSLRRRSGASTKTHAIRLLLVDDRLRAFVLRRDG